MSVWTLENICPCGHWRIYVRVDAVLNMAMWALGKNVRVGTGKICPCGHRNNRDLSIWSLVKRVVRVDTGKIYVRVDTGTTGLKGKNMPLWVPENMAG